MINKNSPAVSETKPSQKIQEGINCLRLCKKTLFVLFTPTFIWFQKETSVQRIQLQRSEQKVITVELVHMGIRYQKEYLTFSKRNKKKSTVLVDILQLESNKKN